MKRLIMCEGSNELGVLKDKRVAVLNAEAEAEKVRIAAEAEAEANRLIQESLTGDLIELKKIEAWDGKLPGVLGSGADTLLGIDVGQTGQ